MFIDVWVRKVDPLLSALDFRSLVASELEFMRNSFPFF
jgi:hypothetical protein